MCRPTINRLFPPCNRQCSLSKVQANNGNQRPDPQDDEVPDYARSLSAPGTSISNPLPLVPPRVSYVLLAANLSVFAAGIAIALTVSGEASNEFFLLLAKVNEEVVAGQYWRLLSATFMHAGLLHLALNCSALYVIGPEAEAVYGYAYFTAIYLLSGLSGSIASYLLDDLVTVGASGALFGLLGALAMYFFRNPDLQGATRQLFFICAVVAFNVLLASEEGGLVDNTGHIAGFASGLWLGWNTTPQWRMLPSSSQTLLERLYAPLPASGSSSSPNSADAEGGKPGAGEDASSGASGATRTGPSVATGDDGGVAPPMPESSTVQMLDLLTTDSKPQPTPPPQTKDASELGSSAKGTSWMEPGVVGQNVGAGDDDVQKQVEQAGGIEYEDRTSGAVRLTVTATFAFSLLMLTWAGTVARGAELLQRTVN